MSKALSSALVAVFSARLTQGILHGVPTATGPSEQLSRHVEETGTALLEKTAVPGSARGHGRRRRRHKSPDSREGKHFQVSVPPEPAWNSEMGNEISAVHGAKSVVATHYLRYNVVEMRRVGFPPQEASKVKPNTALHSFNSCTLAQQFDMSAHSENRYVIRNVATKNGDSINLRLVPVAGEHRPHDSKKVGIFGSFARLSLRQNTTTRFTCIFVNNLTGSLVEMPEFRLAFWSIDASITNGGQKRVTVGPIHDFTLASGTRIGVDAVMKGYRRFTGQDVQSQAFSVLSEHPLAVTTEETKNAFAVTFKHRSTFDLVVEVGPGVGGRTLVLSAESPLSMNSLPVSVKYFFEDPRHKEDRGCAFYKAMDFSQPMPVTNVAAPRGGHPLVRYKEVFGKESQVDLVIETARHPDSLVAGGGGEFVYMGMPPGLSTTLSFSFIDTQTQRLKPVDNFFFSIVGIDSYHRGQDTIFGMRVHIPYHALFMTEDTKVRVRRSLDALSLGASAPLDSDLIETLEGKDGRKPSSMLSQVMRGRTVTFLVTQSVSQFAIQHEVPAAIGPKHVWFGGRGLVCLPAKGSEDFTEPVFIYEGNAANLTTGTAMRVWWNASDRRPRAHFDSGISDFPATSHRFTPQL